MLAGDAGSAEHDVAGFGAAQGKAGQVEAVGLGGLVGLGDEELVGPGRGGGRIQAAGRGGIGGQGLELGYQAHHCLGWGKAGHVGVRQGVHRLAEGQGHLAGRLVAFGRLLAHGPVDDLDHGGRQSRPDRFRRRWCLLHMLHHRVGGGFDVKGQLAGG